MMAGPNIPRKRKPPMRPGYNDAYEEWLVTVDNPYASLPDPERDPALPPEPKTYRAKANARDTPIEHMWAQELISREEKAAADWFRRQCEAARIGGAGVIDPGRIKVDTSQGGTNVSDRAINAGQELRAVARALGKLDFDLLVQACAVGLSIGELARRWAFLSPATKKGHEKLVFYVGRRVRDALVVLVEFRGGQSGQGQQGRKQRFYRGFSTLSANAGDWNAPTKAEQDMAAKQRRRRK